MKLSSETLNILKNFSSINQSILFKQGNLIKTISPQKTVMAMATVKEEFSQEAGIYNLPRFLSICALHEDPDIQFGEKYATIVEGRSKTKYVYADASMIITPPDKEIKLPSVDVSVSLTSADLTKVLKATSVLQLPEVAFVGEGGICYLRAVDCDNTSSDSFGVEVGETSDEFSLIVKTENLQMMPLDYQVSLSSKGISKFESEKVTYFIGIDSKSSYTKGE